MGLFDWFIERFGKKPTMEGLAQAVVQHLHEKGMTETEINLGRNEVLVTSGESRTTLYLGNLFHEYSRAARASRAGIVERFLSGMFVDETIPNDYAAARPRLLPVVRRTADLGTYSLSTMLNAQASGITEPKPLRPAQRTLVGELSVALVCDMPTAMAYITESHLQDWGLGFDQVFNDAVDNLRGLPEHGGWAQAPGGCWLGQWGDSYESSRILIPDLIHRLGIADPVAFVPFREVLYVTSAANAVGLATMAGATKAGLDEHPRWLSFRMYRLQGTEWVEFDPPGEVADTLRELQLHNDAHSYGSQQEMLKAVHEATGRDVFVATFSALTPQGGPTLSYSVWAKDVDTLLPKTDLIALVQGTDDKAQNLLVRWDDVARLAGALMTKTDDAPARYRVQEFPDEGMLRELQALAIG